MLASSDLSRQKFVRRALLTLVLPLSLLLLPGCSDQKTPQGVPATRTPAATAAATPAPATVVTPEPVAAVRIKAREAFEAGRFVAPAGFNALELQLELRDREPGDLGAQQAIADLFPLLVNAAEAAIAAADFVEADRLLNLFAHANPDSVAAEGLKQKLLLAVAAKSQSDAALVAETEAARLRELAEAEIAAPSLAEQGTPAGGSQPASADTTRTASSKPAPQVAETGSTARRESDSPVPGVTAESDTASANAAPPEPPTVADNEAPASAAGFSVPEVLSRSNPDYPPLARSRRLSGWVELEFVVSTDGRAEEITVVAAEPQRLFDRSAQRALSRWRFKPAQRNGVVEPARSKTRINFSAG